MRLRNLASMAGLMLAAAGVAAAVWVSQAIYQQLPHLEDEMADLWQAHVMAGGAIALPSPPEPSSFLVPFVVDYHGLRFSKYPPGWPAALSLGVRGGVPWLVNPLLAGVALWLIFRLGWRLAGAGIGLLAELLALSSPMFLMLAGSLLPHMLSLVLTLAFTLAWLDLFLQPQNGEARYIPAWLLVAVAGGSLGLLALTRPLTAVAIGLPAALHGLWLLWRGSRKVRRRVLACGLLAGILALGVLLWQWALTGDPFLNLYTLWWPYDRLGFGAGIGTKAAGHSLHWAYINTRFSLRAGLHDFFGWPYLSWLLLPFGIWALRRSKASWLTGVAFPSLVGVYALYWVGSWLYGPRYYFEALPALAIFSAAGLAWLAGYLGGESLGGWRWRRPTTAGLLVVLLALDVCFYLPPRLGGMRGLYGVSAEAQGPLQAKNLGLALVIVEPRHSWTEYGTLLSLTPPFAPPGAPLIVYDRGQAQNQRLIEDFPDLPAFRYDPGPPPLLIRLHP
jgi:hypothetical protein